MGTAGATRCITSAIAPNIPPMENISEPTMISQSQMIPTDTDSRPGDLVERFERCRAGPDCKPAQLVLHHDLDRATQQNQPKQHVARFGSQHGCGDQLAGTNNSRGQDQPRPRHGATPRPAFGAGSGQRRRRAYRDRLQFDAQGKSSEETDQTTAKHAPIRRASPPTSF